MINLSVVETTDLAQEIRRRGFACVVFVPNDITDQEGEPAEDGPDWLDRNRKQLEESLVREGFDMIDSWRAEHG